MKIYLSSSTVGRYENGLRGNLRYLNRLIESELEKSGFTSSFDEFDLGLFYPPLYILPGIVGMEKEFKVFYDKLPYSRLNRRFKKIDIKLRSPEFSEHFDKLEKDKYEHRFDIDARFKNISETELAGILIDKYIEAAEIASSKLKKGDFFDSKSFTKTLLALKQNISTAFLDSINDEILLKLEDDTVTKAQELREKRKKSNKPKDKLIKDLRVYTNGMPAKALYPYDIQYTEIFLNLLRLNKLMCPRYHHLYIQVATSLEEALKNSFILEDWYINGIAVVDYDKYQKQNEKGKDKMVFNLIVEGLKDIASIDKLDISVIDKVADGIRESGLDTELIYNVIESKTHILVVSYFAKSDEEGCPVYFRIMDRITNKSDKILVGRATILQLPLWLKKITLTRKKIIMKSTTGALADIWLKDMKRVMEFDIDKILR